MMGEAKEREDEATDGREATKHHPRLYPSCTNTTQASSPPDTACWSWKWGRGHGVSRERRGKRKGEAPGAPQPSVDHILRGMPGPHILRGMNDNKQTQRRSVGKNKRGDDAIFSCFFLFCCAQATPSKTAPQHSPRNA